MEKFTGKEKIALALIGLILCAIFIQVATHINLFNLGLEGATAQPVTGIDQKNNLIQLPQVELKASSHNTDREIVQKVADNNKHSFWHIALDQIDQPSFILIDLGAGENRSAHSLAALPRKNLPSQFLRKATLSGSQNGEDWSHISDIVLRESPAESNWWRWEFENDHEYRYYRLDILQGHEDGSRHNFYSMAELALFE